MRRLLLALLFVSASALQAQYYRAVTASAVADSSGALITGSVCFTPVNANTGTPMGFRPGGTAGLVTSDPICRTLNNGILTANLSLPVPALASPPPKYQITITNNATHRSTVFGYTFLSDADQANPGVGWSLDQYIPSTQYQLPLIVPSSITGTLTVTGAITAPFFHGVSDSALMFSAMPTGCAAGLGAQGVDQAGNAYGCTAFGSGGGGSSNSPFPGFSTQVLAFSNGTNYTIAGAFASAQIQLNGLTQTPTIDYSITGPNITEAYQLLSTDLLTATVSTVATGVGAVTPLIPAGAINGTNATFTLQAPGNTIIVYLNGAAQIPAASYYTFSGSAFTMLNTPSVGDILTYVPTS
jgi:hypothetical protein